MNNNLIDQILNTPTHVRELQQRVMDDDSEYITITSGKTERQVVRVSRRVKNLTRRKNYGTCLSIISPYKA